MTWPLTYILMQIRMMKFYFCPIKFATIRHSTGVTQVHALSLFSSNIIVSPSKTLDVIKLTEQLNNYQMLPGKLYSKLSRGSVFSWRVKVHGSTRSI